MVSLLELSPKYRPKATGQTGLVAPPSGHSSSNHPNVSIHSYNEDGGLRACHRFEHATPLSSTMRQIHFKNDEPEELRGEETCPSHRVGKGHGQEGSQAWEGCPLSRTRSAAAHASSPVSRRGEAGARTHWPRAQVTAGGHQPGPVWPRSPESKAAGCSTLARGLSLLRFRQKSPLPPAPHTREERPGRRGWPF